MSELENKAQETEATGQPQSQETSWLDSLSDSLKQDEYAMKQLSKFKNQEEALQGYVNANKLIGKRAQDLSRDELSGILGQDEVTKIYTSVGRPQTVDEYSGDYLDQMKTQAPQVVSSVKNKAFELGLSNETLSELLKFNDELSKETLTATRESWRTEIQQKYGKEFDKNIEYYAKNAVREFGGKDLAKILDQSGLGDNPVVVDAFVKIGKQMAEDTSPNSIGGHQRSQSVTAIKDEITKLRNDKQFLKDYKAGKPDQVSKLKELYTKLQELEA